MYHGYFGVTVNGPGEGASGPGIWWVVRQAAMGLVWAILTLVAMGIASAADRAYKRFWRVLRLVAHTAHLAK